MRQLRILIRRIDQHELDKILRTLTNLGQLLVSWIVSSQREEDLLSKYFLSKEHLGYGIQRDNKHYETLVKKLSRRVAH